MDNLDRFAQYLDPICNKLAVYKGCVLGKYYEKFEEVIYNMEVRDEDVWVISYPKCGTTWTQEMVWMIVHNLNFEEGKKLTLNDRSPYLESSSNFDLELMKRESPAAYRKLSPSKIDSIGFIRDKMKSDPTVVIKTHLPWQLLPNHIQQGSKKPKIIYVTRNPKDAMVSNFYHFQKYAGFSGSFETACNLFLEGLWFHGPFWSHVLPFYERKAPNMLFITYEQLTKDLPSMIRKIATFLGKSLSEDQVEKLADHLSFEKMKNNLAVNKKPNSEWLKEYKFSKDIDHIRSGKTGSHKEIMSPEMINRFDNWIEENTKGTGLTW